VTTGPHSAPRQDESETRVIAVIRTLARELGGDRVASAVSPTASLEREVGLGSLERVELLMRLESVTGRELDDRFLVYDSAREIARALVHAPALHGAAAVAPTAPLPATALRIDEASTLVDALRRRAEAEPMRTHVLLHDAGAVRRVGYAELWEGASRIAAGLAARGITRGEPVAIMLPTGLDYLQAFMGVLAAGAMAVPLYPPARLDRMAEYLQRQSRILANAEVKLLVAMPEALPVARMLHGAAPSLATIVTVESLRDAAPGVAVPVAGTDPALVQYTSGSTGDPKGVLLTHANLLANIRGIAAGIGLRATDAAVSWLPLYHDMGLIGTWLNMMVHGIPLTLMSPLAFLARPERWLWAIHAQRATLSAAPNFAYELCVRKVRDEAIEGLDLSSWRAAFNGSEPVSAATLDRFARRFAPYGFRREAFVPVYGLAESAVALCIPPLDREPLVDLVERDLFTRAGRAVPAAGAGSDGLPFVSVGRALAGHEVRLVDERGKEVAERVVGRLLFRGPSCMSGYHHNPDATARALLPDGWIDSGDLAYRTGAELFITGRVKDLIKKGGRSLVPQEIEEVVGSIEGIRKGCVAAFGVADAVTGTERVVVLAESHAQTRDERDRLARETVATVAAQVGVPPDVVCIVPPGAVPKTPSGKIQRAAARAAYETGTIGARHGVPWRLRAGLILGAAAETVRRTTRTAGRVLQVGYLMAASTLLLPIALPIIGALAYLLPAGRPVRAVGRVLSRLVLAISGCRVAVDGGDRLPRGRPLVLVTNHTSYADTPVLLAALPIDFAFVAMREVLAWPLIGTLVRRGRHPTVDRAHPQRSVADAAAISRRLRAGEAMLFFAEGGFSGVRGLRPFRLGAFEAAVAAGVPVVPVALHGSRELLPAGRRVPRPGRVRVWVGEPIQPAGTGWPAAVALRDQAAEAVAAHCGEPRLEAAARTTARSEP
jgi:fatty-acyl-CoA synthase